MGKIKERFINILHIIVGEEEEILDEDGNMNMDTFKDENPKVMADLKKTSEKVNKKGIDMFADNKAEQRKETLKRMKATLEQNGKEEVQIEEVQVGEVQGEERE